MMLGGRAGVAAEEDEDEGDGATGGLSGIDDGPDAELGYGYDLPEGGADAVGMVGIDGSGGDGAGSGRGSRSGEASDEMLSGGEGEDGGSELDDEVNYLEFIDLMMGV